MNSYAPDEQTTEIGILPANFCISHHADWTNAVKSYIKEIGITGVRWMKCEVEQIDPKQEEHVMVYCHNREASWVQNVREAVFGQTSLICRLAHRKIKVKGRGLPPFIYP